MGSGHILAYAFDVLMQIYESEGYAPRDAAKLILEKNIYGLDIDRRAYQLAYFSLMMKARQYNRRTLIENINPQVYHPAGFPEGEEFGSLVKVDELPPKPMGKPGQLEFDDITFYLKINAWNFQRLLAQKYDIVVTNPPYMGGSGMNVKLSEFVKKNYPDSKSDLFAVFIEKCGELLKPTSYQAMITQHAWMFLSSYEKLRIKLLQNDILNMAHLGPRAFEEIGGEVVQTTVFVMSKRKITDFKAIYVRLVDYNSQDKKEEAFILGNNRYTTKQKNFKKIPGSPVAYWVSDSLLKCFNKQAVGNRANAKQGLITGNNEHFLRQWFEVNNLKYSKWLRYNKGGEYRKWYGNNTLVVNWEDDGFEIKNYRDKDGKQLSRPQNLQFFFQESISWTALTAGFFNARYSEEGSIFDAKGSSAFTSDKNELLYLLGYLNSVVSNEILKIMAATLDFNCGVIAKMPIIWREKDCKIQSKVYSCINISKFDWDTFETSWDFKNSPLLVDSEDKKLITTHYPLTTNMRDAYENYKNFTNSQFDKLRANEEELNRIFIEIYGLQEELTPEVSDKDITIAKIFDSQDEIYDDIKGNRYILTKEDVIKQFISYAVGCMFGRYSLDIEGLAYAGGEWDADKYKTFIPNEENIIQINDEEYFSDDIVGLFVDFVKKAYGGETLEENLDFIAQALTVRGDSPREIIRNYIIKDFFKDHCKTYKKRPIYWLFDSGKQNGFKALIYMHRYDENTIGNLRIDYLHKMQHIYENEISRMQDTIDNSNNAREIAAATKRKEKLIKQLQETKEYDEEIAHLALARTPIDLDDGVKVNYEKIQTDREGSKYNVMAKI